MLHFGSRWHFAFERDPFGEARLVRFAGTPDGSTTPDPLEGTALGPKEGEFDPTLANVPREAARRNIEKQEAASKEKMKKVVSGEAPLINEVPNIPNPDSTDSEQIDAAQSATAQSETHKSSKEILKRCNEMARKIDTHRDQISGILKVLRKEKNSRTYLRTRQNLEELDECLQTQQGPVQMAREKAEIIEQWRCGRMMPSEYVTWLQNDRTKTAAGQESTNDYRTTSASAIINASKGNAQQTPAAFSDMTTEQLWYQGPVYNNIGNKQTVIQHIDDVVGTQGELVDIDGLLQNLEEAFDKNSAYFEKLEEEHKAIEKWKETPEAKMGAVFSFELYSIMDFYNGAKGWWEAYAATWTAKAKLRQGKIQNKVAGMMEFLPYGKEASQQSMKALDEEHRKVRNEWKEQYGEEQRKFQSLFGMEGEFLQEKNTDKIMAMVEYGAGRGWLYEIRDSGMICGKRLIDLLPSHWDTRRREIYLDSIVGQNEAGFDKEKNDTASSIAKKYDTQKDYLEKEIDVYLQEINIPAAMGAMKALYDRAIDGDEGSKIAAHFMRSVRTNANLRHFLTPTMLQKIASVSTERAAFTMTNIWSDRKDMAATAKMHPSGTLGIDALKGAGNLAKATATAEELLIAASPELGRSENVSKLDEKIAEVLSGCIVRFPASGRSVSIWSPEFAFYRGTGNDVHQFVGVDQIAKTDKDYFASNKSELMLASEDFYKGLFKMESQGTWGQMEKALLFLGHVKNRYEELLAAYPPRNFRNPIDSPASIFRAEVGEKLQVAMSTMQRADVIDKYKTKDKNKNETFIMAWLHANQFINLLNGMGETGEKLYDLVADKIENYERQAGTPFSKTQRAATANKQKKN